jgi:hypothetical protein
MEAFEFAPFIINHRNDAFKAMFENAFKDFTPKDYRCEGDWSDAEGAYNCWCSPCAKFSKNKKIMPQLMVNCGIHRNFELCDYIMAQVYEKQILESEIFERGVSSIMSGVISSCVEDESIDTYADLLWQIMTYAQAKNISAIFRNFGYFVEKFMEVYQLDRTIEFFTTLFDVRKNPMFRESFIHLMSDNFFYQKLWTGNNGATALYTAIVRALDMTVEEHKEFESSLVAAPYHRNQAMDSLRERMKIMDDFPNHPWLDRNGDTFAHRVVLYSDIFHDDPQYARKFVVTGLRLG